MHTPWQDLEDADMQAGQHCHVVRLVLEQSPEFPASLPVATAQFVECFVLAHARPKQAHRCLHNHMSITAAVGYCLGYNQINQQRVLTNMLRCT